MRRQIRRGLCLVATWQLLSACNRLPVITAGASSSEDGDSGSGEVGATSEASNSGSGTESESGDATTGEPPPPNTDSDGDGIPDYDDPFPDDPLRPVRGEAGVVYAHDAFTLWKLRPQLQALEEIGEWSFSDGGFRSLSDIALDQWGVVYALGFYSLDVCDADTARCYPLGEFPMQFNGLGVAPVGVLSPWDDVLVAVTASGDWYRLDLDGQTVVPTPIGGFGGPSSSGDVYWSAQGQAFATINDPSGDADALVACDPVGGQVLETLYNTSPHEFMGGIAGADGRLYLFDGDGAILQVDPVTHAVQQLANDAGAHFMGAGSTPG